MQALRAHRRGGPEQLVYEPVPRPPLGIGDVLLEVHAASFIPTELDWPSTWSDRLGRDRTPVIPAHEVCGVVAALGYGTSGLAVGDEVFGLTDWYRDGAAGDQVAVEARNLAPKPASVDHIAAAALPLAGLTAWQALFDPRPPAGRPPSARPGRGWRGRDPGRAAGCRGRRPGRRHQASPRPGAAGRAGR
jgi:NADPH:quinone reductase-like Zn-dependent oxidoreductase